MQLKIKPVTENDDVDTELLDSIGNFIISNINFDNYKGLKSLNIPIRKYAYQTFGYLDHLARKVKPVLLYVITDSEIYSRYGERKWALTAGVSGWMQLEQMENFSVSPIASYLMVPSEKVFKKIEALVRPSTFEDTYHSAARIGLHEISEYLGVNHSRDKERIKVNSPQELKEVCIAKHLVPEFARSRLRKFLDAEKSRKLCEECRMEADTLLKRLEKSGI